ncbi:MAG: hypothetical protein ABIP48_20865 [Planctomycetota bacterium]
MSFALAIVAALGYLVGRRAGKNCDQLAARSERDLRHSRSVAREMDKISRSLRRTVARHHGDLKQVGQLIQGQQEATCGEECRDADATLDSTLQSAAQIAGACDSGEGDNRFMTVAEARTDPLARDSGDRDPDDPLATQFATLARHGSQEFVAATPLDGLARSRVRSPS